MRPASRAEEIRSGSGMVEVTPLASSRGECRLGHAAPGAELSLGQSRGQAPFADMQLGCRITMLMLGWGSGTAPCAPERVLSDAGA
jgi:hypothetical protein